MDFGIDFLERVARSKRCSFLLPSMQHLFHSYRQHLGRESMLLNDAVGMAAAIYPGLIQTIDLAGDVEPGGELTRGATVFDRRDAREWRDNIDVGTTIDVELTRNRLMQLLG